jgi:hypothetical protein
MVPIAATFGVPKQYGTSLRTSNGEFLEKNQRQLFEAKRHQGVVPLLFHGCLGLIYRLACCRKNKRLPKRRFVTGSSPAKPADAGKFYMKTITKMAMERPVRDRK